MGIRREVYNKLNGFSKMRFGEDIDFSIRIIKSGFKTRLFPDAWVYHKRRTDFRKFWRQVFNSGIARINLYKKYPDSLKLVHLLPAVFTVGVILLTLMFLGGLVGAFVMFQMGYGMEQALPLAISALSLAMLAFYAAVIFPRRQLPDGQPMGSRPLCSRRLHPTHGIRLRIHQGLVAPLRPG